MSKIDVSQWGEFHLYDLFTIDVGSKLDRKDVNLFPGSDYNYIGRTGDNNGIIGTCNRINNKKKLPYPAGALTVSLGGTVGATFVQPKPFYTSQNVDVLLPLQSMSDGVKWFVASCIYREAVLNYSAFVKELNKHIKTDFYIKLPITPDGKPDWEYMDNYIAELAARAHRDVSSLNRVKPKPHKINIDNWQKFKIGDVFEKLTTKSYVRHQLKSDLATSKSTEFSLPLVYAKHDNNGIMYYDKPNNHESHGHCLSVIYNGAVSAGLVFPQISPIGVWAEAYLLRCKYDIDDACLFYLATLLQRVTYCKYSRDDLAVWSKVKYDYIFLPVTSSGQPDFDYMKKYIEMIQASVKCRLQSYRNLDK